MHVCMRKNVFCGAVWGAHVLVPCSLHLSGDFLRALSHPVGCSNQDVPSIMVVGSAKIAVERSRSTMLNVASTPPACGEKFMSVWY